MPPKPTWPTAGPTASVSSRAAQALDTATARPRRTPCSIGFIGLGNMGAPMAKNLAAAGHAVTGFDTAPVAVEGVAPAASAAEAARGRDAVITMLPNGAILRAVYCRDRPRRPPRHALPRLLHRRRGKRPRRRGARPPPPASSPSTPRSPAAPPAPPPAPSPSWPAARRRPSRGPAPSSTSWAPAPSTAARPAPARRRRSATTCSSASR